jgi:hypothetical protein
LVDKFSDIIILSWNIKADFAFERVVDVIITGTELNDIAMSRTGNEQVRSATTHQL